MLPTPFFLDQINPLRGLDLPTLIARQEQAMRGYYSLLQWTYFFIEKKGPVTRAVKRRLLSALSGLDWNIKVADVGDDETEKKKLAQEQEKALRSAYDNISNLRAALTFLALADLRGFSHCNKVYAGAIDLSTGRPFNEALDPWDVVELRPVEQWFWSKQGFRGDWLYNEGAQFTNTGAPIDLDHYVIHAVDDPADEIFAELEVKRKVSDADWDGFLEDYGVPPLFIGMPPNIPRDREGEYQRAAELTVSRAHGALPNGATLLSPSATGSGGAGVFSERLHYLDEQIVIAGTAGKLTVLSEAGSGTLAGTAQKEAFDEIAQAIANQVATALHKQFDEPLLARLFPDQPVLVYFEFAQINVKDTSAVLTDAAAAATAGFAMDEEELSEKTGYKLKYVGLPKGGSAPAAAGPGDGKSPAAAASSSADASTSAASVSSAVTTPAPDPEQLNALFTTAMQQLAEAEAADLVPLRRALETAVADPTPEKLQALLDQLATIQSELGTRAEGVRANVLGTALATGLSS
jgi:hypothetical protein